MAQREDLIFDIDIEELEYLQQLHEATEKHMKLAYNRALKRTAVTLRALARRYLKDELKLRNLKALRKRLQQYQLKGGQGMAELKLWFGLNPLPVSALKGRMTQTESGAVFKPAGPSGNQEYDGAFLAKVNGKKSIWQRASKRRNSIYEHSVPVHKGLQESIEDDVFEKIPGIFLKHFESDLKARVKFGFDGSRGRS